MINKFCSRNLGDKWRLTVTRNIAILPFVSDHGGHGGYAHDDGYFG